MHFLRTLFWVIVAVAMLIFAVQNNESTTINLWGGLQADIKKWLLALGPLVIGFLPTWIIGRISLWRQRKAASAAAQRAMEAPAYEVPSYQASAPVPSDAGGATRVAVDGVAVGRPSRPTASPGL